MKHKKFLVWVICSLFVFSMAGVVCAEQKTAKNVKYEKDEKFLVFTVDGKEIATKMSSSRSSIKVDGQIKGRDDVPSSGTLVEITYDEDGGDNEVKTAIIVTK